MNVNKNDIWPVIRWEERKHAWKVDARTKDGGGTKLFAIRGISREQALAQAQAFAEAQRIKRGNEGSDAFGFSAASRIDATAALELLAPFKGATLRECANFYIRHHAAATGEKTVQEVISELLENKTKGGAAPKYLKDMRIRLNIFARDFGQERILNVTQKQADDWVIALPHAATTKNNYHRLLKVLFNFAVERKYLLEVPMSKQSKSSVKDLKPEILTIEECTRLLCACDDLVLPSVAIGLFAGLRPESEVWRLDWKRVSFSLKKIIIPDVTFTKNKQSVRHIDMTDNLIAWLTPYRKSEGPVWPLKSDAYFARLEKARKAAGIVNWPKDALRHCFGSYHFAAHNNLAESMAQLGHSNAGTFFHHYRALLHREDGQRYFNILPAPADGQAKITPFAA